MQAKRHELGKAKPDARLRRWTPEEDQLLGTMPDADVAAKTGQDIQSVRKRRGRLGIPNRYPQRHVWTPEETALLGTMSDAALAAQLALPAYVVTFKRKSMLSHGQVPVVRATCPP